MVLRELRKRNKRGALFVEAALVIPFLLYILVNIIFFALLMHDYLGLNNLTRNAVRYAAVSTSSTGSGDNKITKKTSNIKAYVEDNAGSELILYNSVPVKGEITLHQNNTIIRVTLTATRNKDLPVMIDNVFPDTLVSGLSMHLEEALGASDTISSGNNRFNFE